MQATPAIAQLVEHLTVDLCSNQMVPGSIPGGRIVFNISHRICLVGGDASVCHMPKKIYLLWRRDCVF